MDPYEERKLWLRRIEPMLLPCGFRVGHVWQMFGKVALIWYWGDGAISGFAGGRTPEDAADDAMRQVFGGL